MQSNALLTDTIIAMIMVVKSSVGHSRGRGGRRELVWGAVPPSYQAILKLKKKYLSNILIPT
jgi:hypothetical protein